MALSRHQAKKMHHHGASESPCTPAVHGRRCTRRSLHHSAILFPMFDKTTLNDLARRLAETVPTDLLKLQDDLEKNFRAILQASFATMNLVSREEFEVQSAVLARTRERLERLEAQVAELEKQIVHR